MAAGRIMPIEKRGEEMQVDAEHQGPAKDGDLVEVEIVRSGRFGLPRAAVKTVIGSVATEKAISMIAIHAHGIPYIFPDSVIKEADAAGPATMSHREDWRSLPLITIDPADAKDHDDAVHAEPDPSPDNEGGVIVTVAIADVSWYVRPKSALDHEAAQARQFRLFSRPRRANAAGADFQRTVLAETGRRPAGARRCACDFRRKAARPATRSIAS